MSASTRDAVFWYDHKAVGLPPLRGDVTADVAVVGGGMMGLMCARALADSGRKVCVVERDDCGGGASGRSSGFITPDSELEFADLAKRFGPDEGKRLWEFAWGGVDLIRAVIAEHNIECDYQPQDALFVAATKAGAKTIAGEHASRKAAGYLSTHLSRAGLHEVLGAEEYHGGIRFGKTFGIDGYRCCLGLRDVLIRQGVKIFEGSPVIRVLKDRIVTGAGSVRARDVVVCGDRFLPELGFAPQEIYHVQTFLAVTRPLSDTEARGIFPAGPLMVWDTDLTYKYFRLTGEQRLLIGGGTLLSTYARSERHRPEIPVRQFTEYLARHFPGLTVTFDACWPGMIGITKDFAPVIGRHPRAASVHFAGGAAGLPWAAALGNYLAAKVVAGRADLDALLAADRKFPVGPAVQRVIRTPAAFACSHGILKFL
jgi:gamma-glutamylputrescine oxidase